MAIFGRLFLLIGLAVILLIVGLVIYVAAQVRYSPNKAKAIVIRVFFWICAVLTAIFLLFALYAVVDKNMAVMELGLAFALVPFIGLIIDLICRAVFLKHNPSFKHKANKTDKNETFVEFWKKRLQKGLKNYISNKFKQ